MQIELKRIQRRLGITFIYVTHDQQEALNMCDRIAVMNARRIVQIGSAREIYEQPRTRFVADFIGDTNFIQGRVSQAGPPRAVIDCDGLTCTVHVDAPLVRGANLAFSVRPERVRLHIDDASEANAFQARLTDTVYSGASVRCMLELTNGLRLKADVDARLSSRLQPGDEVTVGWSPGDGYVVSG
jgi:ABC-type Fe3+/spermidine/putrescine transport system ATPase subunit